MLSPDFFQLAGVCTGAVAIGGAIGAAMQASRKAFKAEEVVMETVPRLEAKLDAHTKEDTQRFEIVGETLQRIERKLDVGLNDVQWLRKQVGGPE